MCCLRRGSQWYRAPVGSNQPMVSSPGRVKLANDIESRSGQTSQWYRAQVGSNQPMVSSPGRVKLANGIEPRSGQTSQWYRAQVGSNQTDIGTCCLSTKNATLKCKSKVWLIDNQDDVPGWRDMSKVYK